MSFWDSIKNAFSSAGQAIEHAAEDAGKAIAGAATDAWDWTKHAGESAALALADGANLFVSGWKDVFSGNFQQGLREMAMGLAEAIGVPQTDQLAKRYEEVLGQTSLWSLQQSKQRNAQICYSEYDAQVKQNIANQGLQWNDRMEQTLRNGVTQNGMTWINLGC